jgi:hypothetical protein
MRWRSANAIESLVNATGTYSQLCWYSKNFPLPTGTTSNISSHSATQPVEGVHKDVRTLGMSEKGSVWHGGVGSM